MTSSLVGSEMCIRDSLYCHGLQVIGEGGVEALFDVAGIAADTVPKPMPCLLYTSDAADDM
eukprot:9516916-Prorocentrum_lima.AAC.1